MADITFFDFVNTGAIILFLFLFVTGRVLSEKVADRIIEESRAQTKKLAGEVLDGMEKSIHTGFLTAMKEYNGENK
jgi:hypothetical protein